MGSDKENPIESIKHIVPKKHQTELSATSKKQVIRVFSRLGRILDLKDQKFVFVSAFLLCSAF